jgi:hypothetical protein
MRKLLLGALSLLLPTLLQAQCTGSSPTWTSTPDQVSVSTCVSKALSGDTINISAGTVTWSGSTIATSKALSIIGAGQGSTVITDSQCEMFKFNPTVVGSLTRLSSMTIQDGSSSCAVFKALGKCSSSGCTNIRVDHITFSGWAGNCCHSDSNSYGLTAIGDMFGVLDHNTINGNVGSYLQFVEFSHASYQGVGSYGDNSWNQSEAYGSANFLFIENNTFNTAGATENEGSAGSLTNQGGGRIVVRFNQFLNMDNLNFSMGWHGTESSGRPRSTRVWEYYGNTYTCNSGGCGDMSSSRGGTGLTWGNTINHSGTSWNNLQSLTTYRTQGSIGWGACDGSTAYDTNDGTTYYSGTIGSVSGSTITVSGSPGWTTNQWVQNGAPYSVHDVAQNAGSEISANGSNTLTVRINGGPGAYTPSAGDSIQILRATVCIDQGGGRGAGTLYSGSPASPSSPANEALSPTYVWMNTINGGNPGFGDAAGVNSDTARVIRNRDYYGETLGQGAQTSTTSPFNGGTTGTYPGIGHGTLANRPTTCTTGVAYFATDQGNWNTSGSGGQGVLYQCTSPNTWTLAYTPYSYPHPLVAGGVTGGGNPPNPPTGLAAVVSP